MPETVVLYRPVGPKELELIKNSGGSLHTEYWIPSDQLEEFNDHIVGAIEVVASYRK